MNRGIWPLGNDIWQQLEMEAGKQQSSSKATVDDNLTGIEARRSELMTTTNGNIYCWRFFRIIRDLIGVEENKNIKIKSRDTTQRPLGLN